MHAIHHRLRWAVALLLVIAFLLPAAPAALAQDVATIHYFRPDGDYTDWGLHAWDGAAVGVEWGAPLAPTGEDDFGIYWDAAVQAADQGNGTWTLTGDLTAGSYEFKAAINGTWDENYGIDGTEGGDNIPLTLETDAAVTFHYDRATNAVWATVDGEVVAGAAPAE